MTTDLMLCKICDLPLGNREVHYHLGTCSKLVDWARKKIRGKSKHRRQRIFKRDKGICAVCGHDTSESGWEADHIIPLSEGGTNDLENFRTLCVDCHKDLTESWRKTLPHWREYRSILVERIVELARRKYREKTSLNEVSSEGGMIDGLFKRY
jgi:5-methylcytosine-specific restriction endonuclease McrA